MAQKRKISVEQGEAAVAAWRNDRQSLDKKTEAIAVRYVLQLLTEKAPGGSVEVRVPPHGPSSASKVPRISVGPRRMLLR